MKSTLSCVLTVVLLQTNPISSQTQSTTSQAKTDKQPTQQPESTSPPVKPPLAFGLDDGTPVRLRINRTISSEDAKVGDTVDFEVLEDVKSHDAVLIPRGGIALATITEAQSKRRMGRAGKLNVNIDSVKLVDGERVALRAVKEVKGGSHVGAMTGAIVATTIVFFPAAPLFLFMKGKASVNCLQRWNCVCRWPDHRVVLNFPVVHDPFGWVYAYRHIERPIFRSGSHFGAIHSSLWDQKVRFLPC